MLSLISIIQGWLKYVVSEILRLVRAKVQGKMISKFESNLQTKDWNIRVNTSILGINDVCNFYIGKYCNWWGERNPEWFHYNISGEIIHNRCTEKRAQSNQEGKPIEYPG